MLIYSNAILLTKLKFEKENELDQTSKLFAYSGAVGTFTFQLRFLSFLPKEKLDCYFNIIYPTPVLKQNNYTHSREECLSAFERIENFIIFI